MSWWSALSRNFTTKYASAYVILNFLQINCVILIYQQQIAQSEIVDRKTKIEFVPFANFYETPDLPLPHSPQKQNIFERLICNSLFEAVLFVFLHLLVGLLVLVKDPFLHLPCNFGEASRGMTW